MAKKPRGAKAPKKRGPPPVSIPWDEVSRLFSYQCTQGEVADWFDISVDTLDNACQRDLGMKLSDFFAQKKGLLKTRLRKIQWAIAEQGSTGMAIFLGKQHLNQTDTPIDVELLNAVQSAGITRDEAIALIIEAAEKKAQLTGKKSFEDFCDSAGFPKPFPKQIEMMQFGMHETEPRLLLGTRGVGKTDFVTIAGVAYDIYVNPMKSTNLIVTKSKDRSAAILEEIKNACIKNGMIFEKANSTTLRVRGLQGKDPSVAGLTLKATSIRGRHPFRIVLDDPVTEDDTSDATRKLAEKKYNEFFKLTSNILIIGQPAHRFDLYAKVRNLIKKMEVPHGMIPELDHDLEAQRLAGVDESSIQASYFLKIVSDDASAFSKIKTLEGDFGAGGSVAFIDPSHEGGDFTALTILRAHFEGVAVVGFAWKKAWNHCLDDVAKKLVKYGVKKVAFETNALGDQPIIMLRQIFGQGVVGRRTITNKHARIMAAGAYAHQIHLSKESDKVYVDQVQQYEYNAKNDDAPDSLASCMEWIGLLKGKS